MKLPYTTLLNLEGVGLTPTSARALSLVVRGYAACNLCSGQGTIANDIFATGTDPTGEGLTFHQVFNFLEPPPPSVPPTRPLPVRRRGERG